eukprot:PhM_4_TR5676/c0_g1_i1/m.14837
MFLPKSLIVTESKVDIMCVQFSPDDTLLCTGCYDGHFRCYNTKTGKIAYSINAAMCEGTDLKGTVCAARFRPGHAGGTRNVVLLVSGDSVSQWHVTTQRMMRSFKEEGNSVYVTDYNADGTSFASAGKDMLVRLYDEERGQLVQTMCDGELEDHHAHSNRIQSLRFVPEDPNVVLTGGWDRTVQFWDVRLGRSVRHLSGPYVCGDSIDVKEGTILAGSCRDSDPLELFDFGTGQHITSLVWPSVKSPETGDVKTCKVFGAAFGSRSTEVMAACGTTDLKIFERRTGRIIGGENNNLAESMFSCAFNGNDTLCAFGGAGGNVALYEVQRL